MTTEDFYEITYLRLQISYDVTGAKFQPSWTNMVVEFLKAKETSLYNLEEK